jgi:hypothetical protein
VPESHEPLTADDLERALQRHADELARQEAEQRARKEAREAEERLSPLQRMAQGYASDERPEAA